MPISRLSIIPPPTVTEKSLRLKWGLYPSGITSGASFCTAYQIPPPSCISITNSPPCFNTRAALPKNLLATSRDSISMCMSLSANTQSHEPTGTFTNGSPNGLSAKYSCGSFAPLPACLARSISSALESTPMYEPTPARINLESSAPWRRNKNKTKKKKNLSLSEKKNVSSSQTPQEMLYPLLQFSSQTRAFGGQVSAMKMSLSQDKHARPCQTCD